MFLLPTREKPGLDGGKGGGSLVALRGNGRATSDISKTLSDISKATVSSRTAFAIDTKRRIHYSITQPVPFEPIAMGRHANPDIRRAYAEFQDTDTPSKCNKVRCLHCGYVRAKNTTRQIEHLQECQAYLATPEAQAHVQAQQQPPPPPPPQQQEQHAQAGSTPSGPGTVSGPSQILNGQHPNPNLQVNRRGPHAKRTRDGQLIAPTPPGAPHYTPSLTSHLLAICSPSFTQATQQPFLSHAGCGSLAIGPCSQWLAQDAHMARGYIRFIGQLLAKMRLPHAQNSQFHPMYRTMDLLISALNNTRREMQFFEITATKYGLVLGNEPPSPVTRALLDMFVSVSSTSASLLEGMVALWATQHCYRSAWQYAHSFSSSLPTPSNESHIVALQQALIPNWISPAFSKFVDATRALVDELANITTTRDGKEEMQRCEEIFRQTCWLKQKFWPSVDGMGEENESSRLSGTSMPPPMAPETRGPSSHGGMNGPMNHGIPGPSMGGLSNMNNNMNVPMRGPMHNGPRNGPVHNGSMNGPRSNGPMHSGPPKPGSVTPGPIKQGPVNSRPMNQGPVNTGPIHQAPLNPGPMNQGPVTPAPIKPGPASIGSMNQGTVNTGLTSHEPSNASKNSSNGSTETPDNTEEDGEEDAEEDGTEDAEAEEAEGEAEEDAEAEEAEAEEMEEDEAEEEGGGGENTNGFSATQMQSAGQS